jgi:hypothetical protein
VKLIQARSLEIKEWMMIYEHWDSGNSDDKGKGDKDGGLGWQFPIIFSMNKQPFCPVSTL